MLMFESDFQENYDGALVEPLRDRIQRLRAAHRTCTLTFIGKRLGISASFLSGLLAGRSIRSRHIPLLVQKLEALEAEFFGTPRAAEEAETVTLPAEVLQRLSDHAVGILKNLPDQYRADALRRAG